MKILIAEDDEFTLSTYKELFEAEGYTVISAVNGEEAIRLAEEESPDIVVLDILMPDVDGYTALDSIKEAQPTLPVIVVSNLSQPSDKQMASSLGADCYLVKSDMNFEDIVAKVKEFTQ